MKVVHSKKDTTHSSGEGWLETAVAHEREGELREAAEAYEQLVKEHPLNEKAYDKAMKIYRQLKEYKKELDVIDAGINAFEDSYNKKHDPPAKKVKDLSAALLKATGLADKKGNRLYLPGPLARWQKRRVTVENRLKKKRK
jgi:tetratricopeptide (TPR) repeat protein